MMAWASSAPWFIVMKVAAGAHLVFLISMSSVLSGRVFPIVTSWLCERVVAFVAGWQIEKGIFFFLHQPVGPPGAADPSMENEDT